MNMIEKISIPKWHLKVVGGTQGGSGGFIIWECQICKGYWEEGYDPVERHFQGCVAAPADSSIIK